MADVDHYEDVNLRARLVRFFDVLEKLWDEFVDDVFATAPKPHSIGGTVGTPQDNKD